MYMKKKCFKCNKTKKLSFFYVHKQMGDGHLNKCKTCTKRDVKDRYYDPKAIERIRAYERKRFKDPERKKKIKIYARTMRAKYPGKYKARAAVANAIRKGTLKREPCVYCGDPKSQAHHRDYRKKLDIIWACFKCHRSKEHNQHVHSK
jgi:hypothetical protein